MKRFVFLVLLVVFSLAIFSFANGEEDISVYTSDDYEYILLSDDTAEIRKYIGKKEDVDIPNILDGHVVTSIGNNAFDFSTTNVRVNSVSFPSTILSIGREAFAFSYFDSIILPESLIKIESEAFLGCPNLKSVCLPHNVSLLIGNPFSDCKCLESIEVSPGNEFFEIADGVLFTKNRGALVFYPAGLVAIDDKYIVPEGTIFIEENAFDGSSLKEIVIPGSVYWSRIKIPASLDKLIIMEGVNSFELSGYYNNKKVLVEVPESVGSISVYDNTAYSFVVEKGSYTELYCYNNGISYVYSDGTASSIVKGNEYCYVVLNDGTVKLLEYYGDTEELSFPETIDGHVVSAIGQYIIWGSGFKNYDLLEKINKVKIPDCIKTIEKNPFARCSNLSIIEVSRDHETLVVLDGILYSKPDKRLITCSKGFLGTTCLIPEGIRIIERGAFYGCSELTSIILPDSLHSIGDYAFAGCFGISDLNISNKVTMIGEGAFLACSNLNTLSIPNVISAVYLSTFDMCDALKSMNIPASVRYIGGFQCWDKNADVVLYVSHGSYAVAYCKANNIQYEYADEFDWLAE